MKILPLRHKVVVQLDPPNVRTTASGLYLGNDTTHLAWGEVTAIGEEVSTVAVGDRVLVNTLLGQHVGDRLILPDVAVIGTQV